jgi:Zn-dependent protease with chaperone function
MASLVEQGAEKLGVVAGIVVQPVQLALLYWSRCSELSADRAAAVVCGDSAPVVQTMIRLAGGPRHLTESVDVAEYAAQADEYDRLKSDGWDSLLQRFATMQQDHPFTSVRTREILGWCGTEHFQQLQRNLGLQESGVSCPHCGKQIDPVWKFCKACGAKL